jgi:hypothetical protein
VRLEAPVDEIVIPASDLADFGRLWPTVDGMRLNIVLHDGGLLQKSNIDRKPTGGTIQSCHRASPRRINR